MDDLNLIDIRNILGDVQLHDLIHSCVSIDDLDSLRSACLQVYLEIAIRKQILKGA